MKTILKNSKKAVFFSLISLFIIFMPVMDFKVSFIPKIREDEIVLMNVLLCGEQIG